LSEQGADDDLEDLFESAPCGYLSLAPDGAVVRANRTLGAWLGRDSATIVGGPFYDLLPIAGRMYFETHLKPQLRMQGFFNEVALELLKADGARLPIIANGLERRGEDGQVRFTRITLFVAVERRRYERDLLAARHQAESTGEQIRSRLEEEQATSQLREQFIAVLGHDLRNPLAAIMGAARLLRRETLSDKGAHILSLMNESVLRMSGLVDNVLDFARGRLGGGMTLSRDAEAPLGPVLEQVVAELRAGTSGRTIETHFDLIEPINCDRSRIGQLVSNLLGNAVTHGDPAQPLRIHASNKANTLEISVANGGEPISETTRARLFQPFFRGEVRPSQQGLGLGLHIASEIAKAHGGSISVTSDQEETRFTFTMPSPSGMEVRASMGDAEER
jgi:sigma-B regulation protein RsbU (phosphoserine phosphatase)